MWCLLMLDPNTKCKAPFIYFFLSLFFISSTTACSNGNCQVMQACSSVTDCAPTLYCSNCPSLGRKQFLCTRGQATFPTSFV
ncbi:hypothetical protein Lalb_Chr16g0378611 [Lupinus albus]|uniref:Uncharacterized protein n=1 Tax=Lupinus albus TaxID=3870 RepID=A0A6A4NSN5_LUPAL|nr:hypothetical protein Lalb_Chr16g0378611 [Lupinus albus]